MGGHFVVSQRWTEKSAIPGNGLIIIIIIIRLLRPRNLHQFNYYSSPLSPGQTDEMSARVDRGSNEQ